jgi:hypothetical protein
MSSSVINSVFVSAEYVRINISCAWIRCVALAGRCVRGITCVTGQRVTALHDHLPTLRLHIDDPAEYFRILNQCGAAE